MRAASDAFSLTDSAVFTTTYMSICHSVVQSGKGRPLGYLAAWLMVASDQSDHAHYAHEPTLEKRKEAREVLKTLVGAAALMALERPQREGEPEEPEGLP